MATCKELNVPMEFPFLRDLDTVKHLRKSKMIIIIRGLPGSGKSTLAQAIQVVYPARIVAPEHNAKSQLKFNNAQYDWAQSDLGRESCKLMASTSCSKGIHTVIVDDDNIKMEHMKVYFEIANQHGYMVLVVEPCTAWKFDAHLLSRCNSRGIHVTVLNWMMSQWETCVPVSFGWTLNSTDTKKLIEDVARDVLETTSTIPAVIHNFKRKGILNIEQNFITTCKRGVLQCISCFCMNNEGRCVMYTQQPQVQQAYGKITNLTIVGFVISKDTFTARVKLSSEQLRVWYQDDNVPSSKQSTFGAVAQHPDEYDDVQATKGRIKSKQSAANAVQVATKKTESVTELMVKIRIDNSDLSSQLNAAILDGLAIRIKQSKTPGQGESESSHKKMEEYEQMFYKGEKSVGNKGKEKKQQLDNSMLDNSGERKPVLQIGSRAHILIGRARGVPSVQGGLDVLKVVEHEACSKPNLIIPCKHGKLLQHGENLWYFYLNQEIVLKSLFTGCF